MSISSTLRVIALVVWCVACSPASEDQPEERKAPDVVDVKDYYDNGQVSKEGKTVDGQRVGLWRSYYPNGLKWSETSFRGGVKEGPTATFYPNGMMRYTGFYHDDARSGMWYFYDTLGTVVMKVDMELNPTAADSLLQQQLKMTP